VRSQAAVVPFQSEKIQHRAGRLFGVRNHVFVTDFNRLYGL
jgi:hypothetical protein